MNDDQVEQGDIEVYINHILECPSTLDVSWIFVDSSDLFNVMFKRNVNIKLHIVFLLPRKNLNLSVVPKYKHKIMKKLIDLNFAHLQKEFYSKDTYRIN